MPLNFIARMLCLVLLPALSSALWAQSTNQILTAGYSYPFYAQATYGQIFTLFVPALPVENAVAQGFPVQTSLSGISVSVKAPPTAAPNYPEFLPIFSVFTEDPAARGVEGPSPVTEITVQIPTEATCVGAECVRGIGEIILNVQAGGVSGPDFRVVLPPWQIHFLNTCDILFLSTTLPASVGCRQSVTHADGSYVTTANPAVAGETIVIYAVGLGPTNPPVPTGQPAPVPAPVAGTIPQLVVSHQFDTTARPFPLFVPDAQLAAVTFAGLVPGYAGLYQIDAQVPPLPAGTHVCSAFEDTNTRFSSIDGNGNALESFDLCVQAK